MKRLYRWVDGPATVARVAAPGEVPVGRGGTLRLTAAQVAFYRGRGYCFVAVTKPRQEREGDDEETSTTETTEGATG